ncbi:nodulation S family protein [Streptomyces scopuliridis]|uniref:SAM-dependent methyltransferase n=1 Tax=Streptomyces scopuliridis TaxID=452529 RepID=UPI002DD7BBB2|nr:SAM-dependent methyltransferase [Streptomyces scopuliridis]WSB32217.1 nodulation S family protein [Streptomyces scopuliridis]
MIDIVVVLRAEDAVLDFLSVLTDDGGGETRVILADRAETLILGAGMDAPERLALIASHVGPVTDGIASPGPEILAPLLRQAAAGRPCRIWTHSPADNRRSRGRLGRDTALARAADAEDADADLTRAELRHAVGFSPYLQILSDLDRPLGREHIAAKLDFVNGSCGHLLAEADPEFVVQTPHVPAVERFFDTDPDQRERLFALLASLDDEAASVVDPWEFGSSPYEARRLDATAAWVRERCTGVGSAGTLVEVGACEGALTHRLAAAGFTVRATEPNAVFRPRLTAALAGTDGVTVDGADLAELAKEDAPRATAQLLIEMLYYGQDLALLDDLATDLVFVALEPDALASRVRPWLERSATWRADEEIVLVPPQLETVCAGRAYLSKRGSVGLLLRRTNG